MEILLGKSKRLQVMKRANRHRSAFFPLSFHFAGQRVLLSFKREKAELVCALVSEKRWEMSDQIHKLGEAVLWPGA
jgi:hypothetical protein